MEDLKRRYAFFAEALITLEDVLRKFKDLEPEHPFFKEVRDSVIKRFEYTEDAFWKFFKTFIENKYGVVVPANPKGVAKCAFDIKFISLEEYNIFIDMIDDRNLSSHTYNEILIEEMSANIFDYYFFMCEINKKIAL